MKCDFVTLNSDCEKFKKIARFGGRMRNRRLNRPSVRERKIDEEYSVTSESEWGLVKPCRLDVVCFAAVQRS